MIIFFTVLGVLMLAGGGYAIYDGLPYLVLERGFTQVIIGTVVTVAGIVVLALARVLSELRRVRLRIDGLDQTGPSVRTETPVAPSSVSGVPLPQPERSPMPEERGRFLPAAIGLGAGALAGVAASRATTGEAEHDGRVGSDSVGENPETVRDEPDLFASHLAEWDRETEQDEAARVEAASAGPEERIDAQAQPAETLFPPTTDTEEAQPVTSADLASVVTDGDRPSHLADADMPAGDPDRFADLLPPVVESEVDPDREAEIEEPNDLPSEPAAEAPKRDEDEFGALRQSLSQTWTREDTGGRSEPMLPGAEDRRSDGAEDWMVPAGGRREPWFEPVMIPPEDSPASNRDDEAGAVHTQEPALPLSGGPSAEKHDDIGEPAIEASQTDVAAGGAQPEAGEPEPRPASEEGIVGAYQVGDAHFTIYANGSIQARTKDGDYSFASMEELKAYLASEKSRLGG